MTADFKAAWSAHQPAIEAAAKQGMDLCRERPSDHLFVICSSLEWKLGCHMTEWKAARELAYRMGKAGDELNQAHCEGVLKLLREHLAVLEGCSPPANASDATPLTNCFDL